MVVALATGEDGGVIAEDGLEGGRVRVRERGLTDDLGAVLVGIERGNPEYVRTAVDTGVLAAAVLSPHFEWGAVIRRGGRWPR